MRQCSISRFGTTQVCPSARNDTAAETGSNEAQRSSAQSSTNCRNEKEVMFRSAWRNVQKELHQLLEEFSDLFPEQLPKGKPPKQEVEFEIKLEEGAVPPNKPPYRLSPKEHDELQAQIDDLLAQGHIRPALRRAPTEPQFFLCQRRMGAGACVWTIAH